MTRRSSAGWSLPSASRQRANGCGMSGLGERRFGFCSVIPTATCRPRVSSDFQRGSGVGAGVGVAVGASVAAGAAVGVACASGDGDAGGGSSLSPQPAMARARERIGLRRLDGGDLLLLRDAEGGAAAAGRDDVGVVDLEAGALKALDVVDDGALDVREARAVDQDPQAVVLEDLVAVALRVERERVLEAGAAAAAHADAQAGRLDVGALRVQELLDLLCTLVGERDQVVAPVLTESNASRSVAAARLSGMPSTDELRQRIETAIPGSTAEVQDLTGGGDHFRATVIAPGFADLSRIEQHRAVYAVFGDEIGGPIHALSLETKAE